MTTNGTGEPTFPEADVEPAFLEVDPPHWAARGTAYILIALFAVALIGAVFVHVPETVSGPFVLVPVHGTDPVRASHRGLVAAVKAAEGQAVTKGEALFVIQSEPVGDRSTDLRTLEAQGRGAEQSLANARGSNRSQVLADQKEIQKLTGRIENLGRIIELKQSQLAMARERAERYKKGQEGGFTSWEEYSAAQMEADNLAVQLEESEAERADARAAVAALRYQAAAREADYRETERRLQEEAEKTRIRIAPLEKELAHTSGNQLTVVAPCEGTVLRLQVQGAGAVVQEGDVLCELACSGERLQAELTVPQAGMALLKPGQGVKLLYDAFPYQRYGVRRGTVRWISPASVSRGDSTVFRALVDVQDDAIRVRGQPRPLRVGMGGNAQVVVGRRSVISYAFEPIRQLKESLAEAPTI
jgi:membrane fusion protein